jgi:hypothetical protein
MSLEINFFIIQENSDFKDKIIKDSLIKITSKIFIDNFINNECFKFYLTKKSKTNKELTQIENV